MKYNLIMEDEMQTVNDNSEINDLRSPPDFKGVTFISRTSKPVFLDRDELHKFFKATTKYLRYT